MGNNNYKIFLEVACRVSSGAAGILLDSFRSGHKIDYKGAIDLVTEMDHRSEEFIVSELEKKFPSHTILAEEDTHKKKESPFTWIVDPLDGTTNYAHGFGFFAVSIALHKKDEGVIAGVVNAPYLRETYSAVKSGGSYLNGKKIEVSSASTLNESMLATGFPYDIRESGDNIDYFKRFLLKSRAVRRPGAAAIDLCLVASGVFDGFWELKLSPWDMAAGSLIVSEAGGEISGFKGRKFNLYGGEILASNGRIHDDMIEVLNSDE